MRPGQARNVRTDVQRAVAVRNAAFGRVRTVTGVAVAVGAALTAAFTALAASSTHLRRTMQRPRTRAATQTGPVTAPAPPLVSAQSSTPTPATPPAASPSPPAASPNPPVVASGGS
jgi:hypothetical protein